VVVLVEEEVVVLVVELVLDLVVELVLDVVEELALDVVEELQPEKTTIAIIKIARIARSFFIKYLLFLWGFQN